MKPGAFLTRSLIFGALVINSAGAATAEPSAPGGVVPADARLMGVTLQNGHLRARVVDNSSRLCQLVDALMPGYNGLASLIYDEQNRNIFTPAGFNYESCSHTLPKSGKLADAWNAPRLAPMKLEQLDARTARLTQTGAEAGGLNVEIVFQLGDTYVDQTITTWPDIDLTESSTFWASYMNFVQNTSLYLHGRLKDETQTHWLEMTSAGHFGRGTFYRSFDPTGKDWYEYLTDNPVRRQAIKETPASRAATETAGFRDVPLGSFDDFFFGFVDDYVALWIYRPTPAGQFRTWISASGAEAVRRPAWDFGIDSGPQKAGERRTFHVRFVYHPWRGLDDLMEEVARFQDGGGRG